MRRLTSLSLSIHQSLQLSVKCHSNLHND